MKNENIFKIQKHYVGQNCIQIPFEHPKEETITIFDDKEMIYHYSKLNNKNNINKYQSDERRKQFPYHEISTFNNLSLINKTESINLLLDFNKPYYAIYGNVVIQLYAVKIGNQALLISKELKTPFATKYKAVDINGLNEALNGSKVETFYRSGAFAKIKIDDDTIKNKLQKAIEENYSSIYRPIFKKIIIVEKENDIIKDISLCEVYYTKINEYTLHYNNFETKKSYTEQEIIELLSNTNIKEIEDPKIYHIFNKSIDKSVIKENNTKIKQLNKLKR